MVQFNDAQSNARMDELRRSEEEKLMRALAPNYGCVYINLRDVTIDTEALHLVSEETSRTAEVAVFAHEGDAVSLAVRNPAGTAVLAVIETLKKQSLIPELFLVSLGSLEHAWERYHDATKSTASVRGILDVDPELIEAFSKEIKTHLDVAEKLATLKREGSTQGTSRTIAIIFGGALSLKASDIHIEPESNSSRVRYRLDGVLVDITTLERTLAARIVSRLKLLSGLKLNVKKEAQDGRFSFHVGTRSLEVRSSCIPGAYGESMVMRLLDPDASSFTIENLGLSARLYDIVLSELARPNGAIITTGPTGSGKTSALYSFLLKIHTPDLKIITLEDPVEYKLPGIVQTQIGDEYTWDSGLRSILRQDPDVILIGEIRDREVAETAIHAAQTGHLVFTTLHTNSAAAAISRLIDLGVDVRALGGACNIILGQRLVRTLCDKCKKEREITVEEQKIFERVLKTPIAIHTMFEAHGCDACNGSGYKGRIGIFEAIRIDEKVETAILSDTRESAILEAAQHQEIPTLTQDGLLKVLAGITSLDEVGRVTDLYNL